MRNKERASGGIRPATVPAARVRRVVGLLVDFELHDIRLRLPQVIEDDGPTGHQPPRPTKTRPAADLASGLLHSAARTSRKPSLRGWTSLGPKKCQAVALRYPVNVTGASRHNRPMGNAALLKPELNPDLGLGQTLPVILSA